MHHSEMEISPTVGNQHNGAEELLTDQEVTMSECQDLVYHPGTIRSTEQPGSGPRSRASWRGQTVVPNSQTHYPRHPRTFQPRFRAPPPPDHQNIGVTTHQEANSQGGVAIVPTPGQWPNIQGQTQPLRPRQPEAGQPAMPSPHSQPNDGYPPYHHCYYNPPQWPPPRLYQFMPPQMRYNQYPHPPPGYGPPHPPFSSSGNRINCNLEINFRPDDVLVSTFPRSGTTWTIEIVRQLHLKNIRDENHLLNTEIHKGGMFLTPEVTKEMVEAMQSPRVLKTHDYYSELGFVSKDKKCKVIHVMRDPKDVYCSIYEHSKQMHPHREQASQDQEHDKFQRFLDGFIKGHRYQGPGPADWCLFTKEYLENEYDLDMLYVKYEDLKQHPEATISRINIFLGYNQMTPEELIEIKELTSYEKMKQTHGTVHKNTQGKSGSYSDKLTEENIKDINDRISKFLEQIDDRGLNLGLYC